jgi:hypothetical protein
MQVAALHNKIRVLNAQVVSSDDDEPTGEETSHIFTQCSLAMASIEEI